MKNTDIGAIAIAGLIAFGNAAAAQTRVSPPMPNDPGVPIGCLLKPDCGPRLFTNPQIAAPQAPLDPGNGLPCLVNPQCRDVLGPRNVLFQRAVSPNDIARNGVKLGDYIPSRSPRSKAPQSFSGRRLAESPAADCATLVVKAADTSQRARMFATDDLLSRRSQIEAVVSAYKMAVEGCKGLAR